MRCRRSERIDRSYGARLTGLTRPVVGLDLAVSVAVKQRMARAGGQAGNDGEAGAGLAAGRQGPQPDEGGDQVGGPRPGGIDADDEAAGVTDDPAGGVP
jgi:hypothetical protein